MAAVGPGEGGDRSTAGVGQATPAGSLSAGFSGG